MEDRILDKDLFIEKYVERLKLKTNPMPDLETLKHIHRQHLLNIPFENLDIINNKRIVLDLDYLSNKILEENRGGICYELNGLLFHFLKLIGFEVEYISGRVLEDGNEFDHVMILLSIKTDKWLVDVGFGDNFLEPIKFEENTIQVDLKGSFKIIKVEDDKYQLLKSLDGLEYSMAYTFTLQERSLYDFKERCTYFETSPDSRFRRNSMCSLEKEKGRISLKEDKLIITEQGKREERKVNSESEFLCYLKDIFNITLDRAN
jgi:N-hydroxyarylamine O-acetyltransferase